MPPPSATSPSPASTRTRSAASGRRSWAGRLQDDDLPGDPAALVHHRGTPLLFEQVPDAKAVQEPGPPRPAARAAARRGGRAAARARRDAASTTGAAPTARGWVVLADPEGNELCVERSAAERGDRRRSTPASATMPPGARRADERTMLAGDARLVPRGRRAQGRGPAPGRRASPARCAPAPRSPGSSSTSRSSRTAGSPHGLAGQPEPEPWASAPFDDDPDWEFHSAADEPLEDVGRALPRGLRRGPRGRGRAHALDDTAVNARGRAVLAALRPAAPHRGDRPPPRPPRRAARARRRRDRGVSRGLRRAPRAGRARAAAPPPRTRGG